MGTISSSNLSPELYSVLSPKKWHKEYSLGSTDLVRCLDAPYIKGEKYKIPITNLEQQIVIYQFRKDHPQYIVTVYSVEQQQQAEFLCGGDAGGIAVVTERIPFRLADLGNIGYAEGLYIMEVVLKAAQLIDSKYATNSNGMQGISQYIHYTDQSICFTQSGQPKLWLNPSLPSNTPLTSPQSNYYPPSSNILQTFNIERRICHQLLSLVESRMSGNKFNNYLKTKKEEQQQLVDFENCIDFILRMRAIEEGESGAVRKIMLPTMVMNGYQADGRENEYQNQNSDTNRSQEGSERGTVLYGAISTRINRNRVQDGNNSRMEASGLTNSNVSEQDLKKLAQPPRPPRKTSGSKSKDKAMGRTSSSDKLVPNTKPNLQKLNSPTVHTSIVTEPTMNPHTSYALSVHPNRPFGVHASTPLSQPHNQYQAHQQMNGPIIHQPPHTPQIQHIQPHQPPQFSKLTHKSQSNKSNNESQPPNMLIKISSNKQYPNSPLPTLQIKKPPQNLQPALNKKQSTKSTQNKNTSNPKFIAIQQSIKQQQHMHKIQQGYKQQQFYQQNSKYMGQLYRQQVVSPGKIDMNVNLRAKPVITFNKVLVPMQQRNNRKNFSFNEDGNDLDGNVNVNENYRSFPTQAIDTINPLLIKKPSSTNSTNNKTNSQHNKSINNTIIAPNKQVPYMQNLPQKPTITSPTSTPTPTSYYQSYQPSTNLYSNQISSPISNPYLNSINSKPTSTNFHYNPIEPSYQHHLSDPNYYHQSPMINFTPAPASGSYNKNYDNGGNIDGVHALFKKYSNSGSNPHPNITFGNNTTSITNIKTYAPVSSNRPIQYQPQSSYNNPSNNMPIYTSIQTTNIQNHQYSNQAYPQTHKHNDSAHNMYGTGQFVSQKSIDSDVSRSNGSIGSQDHIRLGREIDERVAHILNRPLLVDQLPSTGTFPNIINPHISIDKKQQNTIAQTHKILTHQHAYNTQKNTSNNPTNSNNIMETGNGNVNLFGSNVTMQNSIVEI